VSAAIDTLRLTAEEAGRLLERGEVSAAELWHAYGAAIDARNHELNAFLTVVDDRVGDGVPIALKDIISTSGIRTTAGSKILEGYVPVYDATVAVRCKAAGMPVLGKTNTDEFAMGSSTENSAYGPTRNPWDLSRVPGGSGGGSAAAVAAGLAPWALGSDTGGSVKLPAAFCGNVGLRPTYGTVSRYGIVAFASSLDQIGPVTRNVRDNALLYSIVSGWDANDSTTVEVPPVAIPEAGGLDGVRVGLPRQLNEVEGIEPGVKAAVDAAIDEAAKLGAEIESCELPLSVDYGLPCYYLIAPAEASANLSRYDGVRFGLRSDGADFREMVMRTRHDGLGDEPKRRIMLGTYALSAGYYDAYYGTAQKVRTVIKQEHDALFERFDVLVSPTCATTAFPIGARAADPLAMYLTDILTIPSNMAGLPSLSLPCGLSDGLPVGLQLIGPQFSEGVLYRVAAALEASIGFDPVPGRLR
jgi:aspartyl-tRNA(Asn)/glutamyl-tRNA(Gln) amidotransferase subunit A